MGLAVQVCILNRSTGEAHRLVTDYLLFGFGRIVMQTVAIETDISKSHVLSEYPMICFPELLQMQKHLPEGEEPLTTCGAGILPSSREGEQYPTHRRSTPKHGKRKN